ncbi:MAG TPA: sigma-54 dependent transcriptional regulator [Xanthomonadaceae bacterium]|nr:sigma-54 dependent transcriptional regulator [Xanthomonadaceae bacterium]
MAAEKPRILVADDQNDVLQALRLLLKSEGYACEAVGAPEAALAALKDQFFDAALIDLNYTRDTTSGQEGLELLARIRALDPDLPVVVMTAWATIDVAVQAMQRGAGDFIEKPWENRRLVSVLNSQVMLGRSRRRVRRLDAENQLLRGDEGERFIAEAPSMLPVLELIRRVSPTDANVLVLGENGTGKGVVARQIHRQSRRAGKPLIKVNMGGIAESVFESEMFGHVKGAFTDARSDRIGRFELADGGTLFLDEIANIPPSQQPKLLRVLEDGELERLGSSRTISVDVRIVCATNADLADEVAAGRFRKDLLFRLNTVEVRLPPLRERRPDIVPMAEDFLQRCAHRYQREGMRLSDSARRALEAYPWPGNVRELSHVIERAVLMASADTIDHVDFGLQPLTPAVEPANVSANMTLEQAEQAMIRNALDTCTGNIQRAAEMLGLSRAALYRRLEKFGMRAD